MKRTLYNCFVGFFTDVFASCEKESDPLFKFCHPHLGIIPPAKPAGAQPKVLLAGGEKNNTRWITHSVIHSDLREQSLTTAVRDTCRAIEHPSDKATMRTLTSRL